MKNNKGFTYYELLIVIAIMALMVGFMSIGLGTVYRNNVKRAADRVESAVKAARNVAITKGTDNGWANFYYLDHTLYSYIGPRIDASNPVNFDTQNWEEIATNLDEVSFDGVSIGSGDACTLNFKQSTGEFKGHDFPFGGDPGLHSPHFFRIILTKGDSHGEVDVDEFGRITIK